MKMYWLLAILLCIAITQLSFGQSSEFERYLSAHPLPHTVLKDTGRFKPMGQPQTTPATTTAGRFEEINLLLGNANQAQKTTVLIQNGLVFLADDILLCTEEALEQKKLEKASVISAPILRWTNGKIPYVLPITHPDFVAILEAIIYINQTTNICLVPRTSEDEYVEFIQDTIQDCYSAVGRTGGRQVVNINGCSKGAIIHELGHTAGLFHEHTRADRDYYVTINFDNIIPGKAFNFTRLDSTAYNYLDYQTYDYGSIMHYSDTAFSKNGDPTIDINIPPAVLGTHIGQLDTFSTGDINAINYMYPVKSCGTNYVGTYIALNAPIAISPTPIVVGENFIINTNFINLGNQVFKGCYYAGIFDANNNLVRMLNPIEESAGLSPGGTYISELNFQGGALFTTPGQYTVALYYRDSCTGGFKQVGNELYPSLVYVNIVAATPLVLSVSPTTIQVGNRTATNSFQITSNVPWTISNIPAWCVISPASGQNNATITVVCNDNNDLYAREVTLRIQGSAGVADQFVTITQEGTKPPVLVSPKQFTVPATGGTVSVGVEATIPWNVYDNYSWLSANPTSGTGNGVVSIYYLPNQSYSPRTGYVYVLGTNGEAQQVSIYQEAGTPTLSISPSSLSFTADGGTANVAVSANVSWTLTKSADWLSTNLVAGSSNTSVIITCQPNPNNIIRTGILTFSGLNVPSQTLLVTQAAATLYISTLPNALVFSEEGGTESFSVFSDLSWTATTLADWLYLSPSSHTGDGSVTVLCDPNFSASIRTGVVYLTTLNGKTASVTIQQAGATPVIDISEDTISFTGNGGSNTIELASNTTWRITKSATWLSVSPPSGRDDATITITCQAKTGTFSRSSTIYFYATGAPTKVLVVKQSGSTITLSASPVALSVGATAGSGTISISSNTSWNIADDADWLSVSPTIGSNNSLAILSYAQNTSLSPRSATITVTASGATPATVAVTQDGATPTLTVSPSALTYTAAGGSQTFSIASNTTWLLTETADWLTLSSTSGANAGVVSASCTPNTGSARSTTIAVSVAGLATQYISITQSAPSATLSVAPASLNFNSSGGSAALSVTSNISWTVAESLSWLSVSPASGTNSGSITVTCQANANASSRSGTFTISGSGAATLTVTVTQDAAPATLVVSPTSVSATAATGTYTLSITSNTSWTLSESADWLSLSTSSGTNAGTITLTCDANTSPSSRTANITVSGTGVASQTIAVTQAGTTPTISVSPSSLSFLSAGGNNTFSISANVAWTLSESLSWIQLSTLSGTNNASVQVTCSENTDTSPRSGTITINGSGLAPQTITVTQAGALSGPPASWDFVVTENNHTVILPENLSSDLNGASLQAGDYIGVFFSSNGQHYCAGNTLWSGAATSFPVFGDDPVSLEKDGLIAGESFIVKVWRSLNAEEIDVYAAYAPADILITADSQYVSDGVSMMIGLTTTAAIPSETQSIPLNAGWNTVSSFVVPQKPLLDSLLLGYNTIIRTVEDGAASQFTFSPPVNAIGSWSITQGYRVEALQADTLRVTGPPVDPTTTAIPFQIGWQIIPFFGRTQQFVTQAVLPIKDKIDVLKDNNGKTYIPSLNINTLGKLKPGQGYRLKAKAAGSLTYPASYMAKAHGIDFQAEPAPTVFILPENHRTRHNAHLIFLAEPLADVLQPGDEIGVFNTAHQLTGAAKFAGQNMALTVWGDEPLQPGVQGMGEQEPYLIYIWKQATGKIFPLQPVYQAGQGRYSVDDVAIVQQAQLLPAESEPEATWFEIFPNPASHLFYLLPKADLPGQVLVRVYDMSGQVVSSANLSQGLRKGMTQPIDLSDFASGIYLIQIQNNTQQWTKKIMLNR